MIIKYPSLYIYFYTMTWSNQFSPLGPEEKDVQKIEEKII